jgi:hypothetical protein
VMVGSVIEMGIATAMGLHLAAAVPRLAYPSYLRPATPSAPCARRLLDRPAGHFGLLGCRPTRRSGGSAREVRLLLRHRVSRGLVGHVVLPHREAAWRASRPCDYLTALVARVAVRAGLGCR